MASFINTLMHKHVVHLALARFCKAVTN